MHEFEIFFHDLTPQTQRELLAFAGIDSPKEMNWDVNALTSIVFPDDEEEKQNG